MDGLEGYHGKWNNSDRKKQILYDLIYMWNLKNKTNKQIKWTKYNRNRLINREQVVARGETEQGGCRIGEGDWEVQTSRYKINKSQGCKVYIGNTVKNIVTTLYGDGW